MKAAPKRRRSSPPQPADELPLQALYRVSELARAASVSHRRLKRLLRIEGVRTFHVCRALFVPLTELEDKVPALWESIKAAETLRRALDVR